MHIILNVSEEPSVEVLRCFNTANLSLVWSFQSITDLSHFISSVDIGYNSTIKHILNVFKEQFGDDIIISKNEHSLECFAFVTCYNVHFFNELSEILDIVTFNQFNLFDITFLNKCSQSSQGVTTGSADTNQECVTCFHLKDSVNFANVRDSIFEKNKVH